MENHPAISLLLVVGLIQFWLMPAIAWVLLKEQRDTAASFWFAGTACYAGTATLFGLQSIVPSALGAILGLALVILMLCFLMESMRRELWHGPTPWKWIAGTVLSNVALLVWVQGRGDIDLTRVVQLGVISLLDLGCCVLLALVIRRHRSRALVFVLVGVLVVVLTNLIRIYGYLVHGDSPMLLTFSVTSNLGFVANYLSVVIYSFGYWGFVIEKNRAALLGEIAERTRAQAGESEALDRERTTLELVRERDDLIAQLAKMQRVAQAGALSASIAHEINQPLASVRLNIEEAIEAQKSGGDPARLVRLLERVASENQRAAATIRTLRDIFGGQQSAFESRTMDEVVSAMCALTELRARVTHARIITNLSAPVRVQLGAGELEHVVLNLLSNAFDALTSGSVVDPHVEVLTWVNESEAFLRVRDNGAGVSDDMRGQLFDLFAGSRKDGLGLGLWLTRFVVERHGGEITMDSDSTSGGASFTVKFARG